MIKESDIKVGNVLKYLGGGILYDDCFTVGKMYEIEEFEDESLYIRDNDGDARYYTIFKELYLWDLIYCVTGAEEPSNEISLALTKDEAQMLADVLACVGGCPKLSRRKFEGSITQKLANAGVYFELNVGRPDITGSIHCMTIFDAPVKETVEYNGSTYDKVEFDNMLANLEKL